MSFRARVFGALSALLALTVLSAWVIVAGAVLRPMTRALMQGFITKLEIPEDEKQRLLAMTPGSYTGKAAELARRV